MEHENDLCWHALNYRTAATTHAEQMWQELDACVKRLILAGHEEWRPFVMEMQEAVLDTMASGRPVAHLDSAVGALVSLLSSKKI